MNRRGVGLCLGVMAVAGVLVVQWNALGQDRAAQEKEALGLLKQARTLRQQGKSPEAIRPAEKALLLAEEVFGKDDETTAGFLNVMGLIYYDIRQYDKAEPLYLRCLRIQEKSKVPDHLAAATILDNLANLYNGMRRYAKAEPLYLRSLKIRENQLGPDHPKTGQSLNNLATLYEATGQYSRAEPLFLRCLKLEEKSNGPEHPDTAITLNNLAYLYKRMGQYAKAEPLYQRSLRVRETKLGPDHPDTVQSLSNLAALYQSMGQYAKAEPLHQRSLQICENKLGPNHPHVVFVLRNFAGLYETLGQYAKAEPLYQRSLMICENKHGPNDPSTAVGLGRLASLYEKMGRYAKAKMLYQRSLKISETKLGPDHPETAAALTHLAKLHLVTGQYAEAEPLFLRCLRIDEKSNGPVRLDNAISLNNLAALYETMGLYAKAEPLFQRSLKIHEAAVGPDNPRVVAYLNNLAVLYKVMGEHAKGELLYQRALKILEKEFGPDHPRVAEGVNNLAALHKEMGQYAKAATLYERSSRILEKLSPDPLSMSTTLSLANWYKERGDFVKAEALYQLSLKTTEKQLGPEHAETAQALGRLVELYEKMGQPAKAEPPFQRALKICEELLHPEHPESTSALNDLAVLAWRRGQIDTARVVFARSRHGARQYVARALPMLSPTDQRHFMKARERSYLEGSLSLGIVTDGTPQLRQSAAEWLVNGKAVAQETMTQIALLARDNRDPQTPKLAEQLLDVRQQLARLTLTEPKPGQEAYFKEQFSKLSSQEEVLAKELRQAGATVVVGDPWVEFDAVRNVIPKSGILIDIKHMRVFSVDDKPAEKQLWPAHYVAWLTPTDGDAQVVDLGLAEPIDTAVAEVRKKLESAATDIRKKGEPDAEQEMQEALSKLSKLILEPLRAAAGDKKHWIISPDANLWLVPWAALPIGKDKYAVEEYRFDYVVSGRDLVREPLGKKLELSSPLVMADPDYDLNPEPTDVKPRDSTSALALIDNVPEVSRHFTRGRARRLKGTAIEAELITPKLEQLIGTKPNVVMDKQATEALFKKAQRPRVLVLSTHGFFLPDNEKKYDDKGLGFMSLDDRRPTASNWENPLLRCGLLLAGCNQEPKEGQEDGVLTGMEIVGTDLRGTELVVLSACETGLGEIQNGEGVSGLRQAFQLAGAEAVVATLWKVPDRESAQLMIGFFDGLAAKKSKADALRDIQLQIIKNRRQRNAAAHPYFWAAYTLTGG